MALPDRSDARRFRRRILALGGSLFGILFVVMAPMFVDAVESDLESRVPDELAAAGFDGLTAEFDGQDGSLRCAAPLSDPQAAVQAAYEVWGVRAIELDRSCRVNPGDGSDVAATQIVADTAPEPTGAATVESTTADSTETSADVAVTSTSALEEPAFETLADAAKGSPQLSLLSVLLQEAGLAAELADPDAAPVTLFAPSDEAFEALPADVLGALRADSETLRAALLHHMAPGSLTTADLVPGPLEMVDGAVRMLTTDPLSIDGFAFGTTDLDTHNGVIHIIRGVLLPPTVETADTPPAASVDVQLDGTTVTLTGAVVDEAVRERLVAPFSESSLAVTDAMTIDTVSGLDSASADDLAVLLGALRSNLVTGSAGFDGEHLYLRGTYATPADRDAAATAADAVGVEADLEPPPVATPDDAVDLEGELNDFVARNPILFEPSSAVLTEDSNAVLDEIARLAQQFESITIAVHGHTDSDGNANDNLWLSRVRARVVRDALVARGLAGDAVTWEGFGSQEPIVVDGVEDKAASRRVEFEERHSRDV